MSGLKNAIQRLYVIDPSTGLPWEDNILSRARISLSKCNEQTHEPEENLNRTEGDRFWRLVYSRLGITGFLTLDWIRSLIAPVP